MQEKEKITDIELVPAELEEMPEQEKFSIVKFSNEAELNKALVSAENSLKFLDKLREFVMKRTKPNDWTDQSGNPYFGEAGCNRFAAPFGIYEKDVTSISIDADGIKREVNERNMFSGDIRYFIFKGIIGSELLGTEASFEGGAKLGDGFKDKDEILFYYMKAKANWRGRGYRKILGMENMTWGELEAAGIKRDDVKKIERLTTTKADSKEADELWKMLLELNEGVVEKAEDHLFKITNSEKYTGKRKPNQLTEKQIKWIMPKVKSEYDKKFPGTTPANGSAATTKEQPIKDQKSAFLASIDTLSAKIGEERFRVFLTENGIDDLLKVDPASHNSILLKLSKLAEGKGK